MSNDRHDLPDDRDGYDVYEGTDDTDGTEETDGHDAVDLSGNEDLNELMGLDPLGIAPAAVRGAAGFWIGNSVSLGLVAIGLLWYLRVIERRARTAT